MNDLQPEFLYLSRQAGFLLRNRRLDSEQALNAYMEDGTHIELEMENEQRFPNWKAHNVGTYKNSEFQVADMAAFLEAVTANGGRIITPSPPPPPGGPRGP